jgi:hypothetical protein
VNTNFNNSMHFLITYKKNQIWIRFIVIDNMRLKDTNETNFILTCKMRRINYIIKYHTTLIIFYWYSLY